MTPQEEKLLELINTKESVTELIKAAGSELEAHIAGNFKEGHMFQGPDGTVYKIVKPLGTFTFFRTIDYVRTRKNGEKQGSLSMKEAQEAGFVLPKEAKS